MTPTRTAAPPAGSPPPVVAATTPADRRPCAHCGRMFPTVGAGSSWPWTNRTRICLTCLDKVDQ